MKCPKCSGASRVTDNVTLTNGNLRKRKCLACGNVFYTEELEIDFDGFSKKQWNKNYRKSKKKNAL